MTAPMPMETEPERRARIRENVQRLLAAGIDKARIDRYLETERITPEMEAVRTPLSGAELAGGAVSAFTQGTTFNLGDEVAGGLSGVVRGALSSDVSIPQAVREDVAEQRQQLGRFREANPGAALGLELGGGLLGGLGIAKAAGAGATGLSAAQKVGRVAASGAGGGALAGYGSGEGSPVSGDRLVRSAIGAGAGYAGGKVLTAVAPAWASSVAGDQMVTDDLLAVLQRAGTAPGAAVGTAAANAAAPSMPGAPIKQVTTGRSPQGVSEAAQRAAARAIGPTAPARSLLDQLEAGGMGEEALAMNVGGDRTVRAVRAAANMPSSDAGQIVNERLARQGGRLGEQVPRDIGSVTGVGSDFPEVTQARMQQELTRKVDDRYQAFRDRGDLMPERTERVGAAPTPVRGKQPKGGLSARDAQGRLRTDLSGVSDVDLDAEYTRLLEAQSIDEGRLQSLRDTPEFGEYDQMDPRMREDRRGVLTAGGQQVGDVAQEMALEAGRVKAREASLARLRAEIDKRGALNLGTDDAPLPDFMNDLTDNLLGLDDASARQFARYVQTVRRNPALADLPESDARVIGEAFHLLQQDVRASGRGTDAVTTRARKELRDRVLAAIEPFDEDFTRVTRDYALDEDVGKVVQDAFQTGRDIKTPGQATVAMGAARPAEQKAIRAGNVATLQSAARRGASNADLGDMSQFRDVARAVVGTPEARETFIALHGEDAYQELLSRLMPKIRAAAQNAAARGNSTTAKQLMDALAFGDDAALDALNALASGSPAQGIMRNMIGRAVSPAQQAMRLGIGQTATETADLLTTRGAPQIRSLLELLDQLGQTDAARQQAVRAPAAAIAGRLPNQRTP